MIHVKKKAYFCLAIKRVARFFSITFFDILFVHCDADWMGQDSRYKAAM